MPYRPNFADSFTQGLQAGAQLGTAIRQGFAQQDEQKRQAERDARENALLQLRNPGLEISSTTPGQNGAPDSLKAMPVAAGHEGDVVQNLGPGMNYNPRIGIEAEAAMADRERTRKLALKEAELKLEEPYNIAKEDRTSKREKGLFDYKSGSENSQAIDMLQRKADIARQTGDEESARKYESDLNLLREKAKLFPSKNTDDARQIIELELKTNAKRIKDLSDQSSLTDLDQQELDNRKRQQRKSEMQLHSLGAQHTAPTGGLNAASAAPPAAPAGGKMTKEKFDALQKGDSYTGNDGRTYIKP